jgi:beta-lactamase superfamily II metal-dependent hydrolase
VVNITFKNVGEGDSIILEWKVDGIDKIGVIDCNLYQSNNPVLSHIIDHNYRKIEFLLLSHPHFDHFSGFVQLLNYCREKDIKVSRFLHTSIITPDYLKSASRSLVAKKALNQLFALLKEMRNKEELAVNAIDDNLHLKVPLGEEFAMEVLAPSAVEIDKYARGASYPFDEEVSTANPNANWLATVLKIYNQNLSVILTSDVDQSILTRIGKKNSGRLGEDKLILAQVPHHGSKGNLNKRFWQMRKRFPITPAVISVGKNTYGHPSEHVIHFFNKLPNYKIYRTDQGSVFRQSQTGLAVSRDMDVFSRTVPSSSEKIKAGDRSFQLSGNQCLAG